jgi:NAD(P)-dependent dehydrogenase (short-subunit alcohol dehydrogenase family)
MDDTGQDRLAIIIGHASGIGAAVPRLMVARGWQCAMLNALDGGVPPAASA